MFETTSIFPKVLRRDQLRRKHGEEEHESEPKGAVPMKRPASNRGRGRGRGRGKAAKTEGGDQESAPGEGEDSEPAGSTLDNPKEDETPKVDAPKNDTNEEKKVEPKEKAKPKAKVKAKGKAKAKVVATPKKKVKTTPKKKNLKSPKDIWQNSTCQIRTHFKC